MAHGTKFLGVEGLWNTRKETLRHLQDRLSKTPSRNGSAESEKFCSHTGSDLRRGPKLPIPPLSRKSSTTARDSSADSSSISSDEVDFIASPQSQLQKKRRGSRAKHKKARHVSLTVTPQPPTIFYAPPPMQPIFMPAQYAASFLGMPQQPIAVPVQTGVNGQVPIADSQQPKKSSIKQKVSDQDDEETPTSSRTRRRKTKRVRILDVKEAVDAETSTDEISSASRSAIPKTNIVKDVRNASAKTCENSGTSPPPSLPSSKDDRGKDGAFDWDTFFAPRMAPPLLFPEADTQSSCLETLSMLSNTVKQQSSASASNVGRLTVEMSNDPTPIVFRPAIKDLDAISSASSPVPKLAEEDRTIAWLTSDQTVTSSKDQKYGKKLPPIAEEVLKSYEKLKKEQYNVGDEHLEGELASANRRLERYFNQLRDLDHFILDQEAKLIDKQQRSVEKKANEIKPVVTMSMSPRLRPSPHAASPPPMTIVLPHDSVPRESTRLLEEMYGHFGKSKEKSSGEKPLSSIAEKEPKAKASPKKVGIYHRFTTNKPFANYLFDGIFSDLLDEIITLEIGRVIQATSVEAVSALIDKKLSEDFEEKRAMTRKVIERLPSPTEVVEKAVLQTEATVQKIIRESTALSMKGLTEPISELAEDSDIVFLELNLLKQAEEVINDVLDVDLNGLTKELIFDLSIEAVVEDFLLSQVVAVEMQKIASEAMSEVERRRKRTRRRQMKDSLEGPVMHAMLLDTCLLQIAQQSLILSPKYETDVALYDAVLHAVLSKLMATMTTRSMVAECLPMRRYHEKAVSDIAMDSIVNELIKTLDIDMAEVDDFETGRDFDFSSARTPPTSYLNSINWNNF